MTEAAPLPDLAGLLGADAVAEALADVVRLAAPVEVVPGWATVDMDRSAGPASLPRVTAADDLLGAVATIVRLGGAAPHQVVLLEPSTEGPLAAALARHGEGWAVAYLRGVAATAVEDLGVAGYTLSALGRGPFGPQRRVALPPRDGPFVLLVSEP